MKEFKDYATILDEQNAIAKEKRERTKQLRKEAEFEMRMQKQKWIEENDEIVSDIREHYTNEQIANKEYLLFSTPNRNRLNDITNDLKGSESERQFGYFLFERQLNEHAYMLMEISKKLEILRERIYNIEEGNPSIYQPLTSFDA